MANPNAIRTAVVGVGYLGKFHAQKYATIENCQLIGVADNNHENAQRIAAELGVEAFGDYKDLFGKIDAVSIVTPTTLHHKIAKEFLCQGIHVLVEKPITVTPDEARDLIETAKKHNCTLQVGHLERFNAAMLDLDKVLINPRFIEAHRLAPYKPRGTDVDVILDLMIHDIDIILSMVRSELINIDVSGTKVLSNATDIANARLSFANGCVANVTASRISLKSERKMRIFQSDAYLSIDFQHRIFSYHQKGEGEMFPGVPDISSTENIYEDGDALHTEITAFINCVQQGTEPLVSGEDGLRALVAATRITEMLQQQQ